MVVKTSHTVKCGLGLSRCWTWGIIFGFLHLVSDAETPGISELWILASLSKKAERRKSVWWSYFPVFVISGRAWMYKSVSTHIISGCYEYHNFSEYLWYNWSLEYLCIEMSYTTFFFLIKLFRDGAYLPFTIYLSSNCNLYYQMMVLLTILWYNHTHKLFSFISLH